MLKMNLQFFAHRRVLVLPRTVGSNQEIGCERADGQFVRAGNILYDSVVQKSIGLNVGRGGDDTLFALVDGIRLKEKAGIRSKHAYIMLKQNNS